ncbi:MAG: hypothetical protein AB1690_08100, partial [Candidatus Zixiibacteriota bacterium]
CDAKKKLPEEIYGIWEGVKMIREELFGDHMITSCSKLRESYRSFFDIDPFDINTYSKSRLKSHVQPVISVLKSLESNLDKILEAIDTKKILLESEFGGVVSCSSLTGADFGEVYRKFMLFPFRVKVDTPKLVGDISLLKSMLQFPEDLAMKRKRDVDEFRKLVSRIIRGCSNVNNSRENYWCVEMKPTDTDKNGLERRLVLLILLLALGYTDLVVHGSQRMLSLKVKEFPFKKEFRVIHAQARIRQVFEMRQELEKSLKQKPSDEEVVQARRKIIRDLVSLVEGWINEDTISEGEIDERLLHISAFAVGTLARHGWLSGDVGQAWVIERCKKVLRALDSRTNRDHVIMEDDMHLKGTVLANLAYYMSIECNDTNALSEAAALYESNINPLEEKQFTGMCMHNKGYVYYRRMLLSKDKAELDRFYSECTRCYIASTERYFRSVPEWSNINEDFETLKADYSRMVAKFRRQAELERRVDY